MRRTRTLAGIGIATVALFALTACNSGSPSDPGAGTGGDEGEDSTWFCLLYTSPSPRDS